MADDEGNYIGLEGEHTNIGDAICEAYVFTIRDQFMNKFNPYVYADDVQYTKKIAKEL